MQSLLDKFKPQSARFVPASPAELFALRLAQKLGDDATVRHYRELLGQYTEEQMLSAYRRAVRATQNGDRGRRFHLELRQAGGNGSHERLGTLLSIRVERRTVAAAVFSGTHLEYTDSRQLSSANDKAVISAAGFISWLIDRFPVESAALEAVSCGPQAQRTQLHDSISEVLRARLLAIWQIPKDVLLAGCGKPALKSRSELRECAATIWPILSGSRARLFIQEAAILGLFVQMERLLSTN